MNATRDRSFDSFRVAVGAVTLVFVGQVGFIALHMFGWFPLEWHRSSVPYYIWGAVVAAAVVWSIARLLNRRPTPRAVMPMIWFALVGVVLWLGYSRFVSFVAVV